MKVGFIDSVKQAIEIVKLNGKAAVNISKDKNVTLMGILIIAIGSVLTTIGSKQFDFSLILIPLVAIIFYFIGIGVMHILARLFGGKAKYMEYFRAESHAAILGWLGILAIISYLGGIITFLTSIWGLVVSVVILKNVHKLTRGKAIIVVLLPFLAVLVAIGALAYFGVLTPDVFLPTTP